MRQDDLETIFPTLVRYTGLTLVVVVTALLALGYPVSPAYVPAAGMILYKTVHRAASGSDHDEEE